MRHSLAGRRAERHRILAQILQFSYRVQHSGQMRMRPLLCSQRESFAGHMDRKYGPWINGQGVD